MFPSAVVLSHHEQFERLAASVPQAVPVAVLAGDPRFDRLRASLFRRTEYRAALGVAEHQKLVVVSSSWLEQSLFGSWPALLRQLLAELPLDEYVVAAVLHPNLWYGHSPLQVELWLADCRRAGLRLVPPQEGWGGALIAADLVVGDHGATTCYAAAIGRPVALAAFPDHEVAPGTCVELLGRTAPRLNRREPLLDQLRRAETGLVPDWWHPIADLVSSVPDQAAALHRTLFYSLLDLPEPAGRAPVWPLSPAPLRTAAPRETGRFQAMAVSVSGRLDPDGRISLTRYAADTLASRPNSQPLINDPHLVVDAAHPGPDLHACAAVVYRDWTGIRAEAWFELAQLLAARSTRQLAAAVHQDGVVDALVRDGRRFRLSPGEHPDPLAGLSALYLWLVATAGAATEPPDRIRVDAGYGYRAMGLTPVRPAAG